MSTVLVCPVILGDGNSIPVSSYRCPMTADITNVRLCTSDRRGRGTRRLFIVARYACTIALTNYTHRRATSACLSHGNQPRKVPGTSSCVVSSILYPTIPNGDPTAPVAVSRRDLTAGSSVAPSLSLRILRPQCEIEFSPTKGSPERPGSCKTANGKQ